MHTGAPKKRGEVRERVLQLAESAILEKGFGATSIEELIAAAGITKSGFFYHFKDKTELARILLTRYIEREDALFDDLFRRADELAVDTGMSNTFFFPNEGSTFTNANVLVIGPGGSWSAVIGMTP